MLNKIKLDNGKKLESYNKTIKFDYDLYIKACKKISEDIKENFDLSNIELVGIARGGLPMLVTISHLLGIRKISMIQTQMSNSDNSHDYGKFRYLSDNLDDSKKKCILLEDIIYKGVTTNGVIDILKKKNKEVLSVYSLVIDEDFKNIEIPNSNIQIKYVYEINKDDWVYFLWEEDLNNMEGENI